MGLAEELRWKAAKAWGIPGLARALIATSVVYVCFTAFLYLVPLLLNDSSIGVGGGAAHHWIRENYWVFYLVMGSARFLGPSLSELIRFEREGSRRREFRLWAALVCAALLSTGLAYAILPYRMIDFALPLVFLVRVLAEAFKPVQAAYLNELVAWRSMRAFALSLTTALGSLFIGSVAFVLILEYSHYERALESWARPARSVPIILVLVAALAWVALRAALRESAALKTRILPSARRRRAPQGASPVGRSQLKPWRGSDQRLPASTRRSGPSRPSSDASQDPARSASE
jgi:hypothetical protein